MNHRITAWAGMIGPVIFAMTFNVEGWLRPDYHPMSMLVSELSLGPRGWIQIANFIICGILFLIFARGVAAEFPTGRASRVGPLWLTLVGICMLASGFFITDRQTIPMSQMTWHGKVHIFLGTVVFLLMPASCFAFHRRFRKDANWQWFRWWTLAAGILITSFVILMLAGPNLPPAPPNRLNAWMGLIQRAALMLYLCWEFAFAYGGFYQRGG